jgi:hypothetical protein
MTTADWGDVDGLLARAETLAEAWGARARASTSIGQERAILRLFGVHGLDRSGRPLAGAVVDRWRLGSRESLGGGIALPFAMALLEYDLAPPELALDVASGAVDLAFEGRLLMEPDRRAVAEAEAGRLAAAAIDRVDANRTARRELLDLLGDAPRPWIGATLRDGEVGDALDRATVLAAAGIDAFRVEVPIGRELADRLIDAGLEAPVWRPREGSGRRREVEDGSPDAAPTGSQRGLAMLRGALDEIAAERRAYVRLVTAAPALGTPEGAVVAAFERVDVVEADPMAEIVAGGVDPDRALADHAFALRLHRRAGAIVSIGAGPLVVAPDLSSGVPSDPPTRGGRALALQLLAVAFTRAAGLAPAHVVVGGMPAWLADEANPGARAIAEVSLRRVLFAAHPLGFDEPSSLPDHRGPWSALLAASLPFAGPTALIVGRSSHDPLGAGLAARAVAALAAEVAASTEGARLTGRALDHARAVVAAARSTLDGLADGGWRAIVGDAPGRDDVGGLGGEAVAERTEAFDPFAATLGPRT